MVEEQSARGVTQRIERVMSSAQRSVSKSEGSILGTTLKLCWSGPESLLVYLSRTKTSDVLRPVLVPFLQFNCWYSSGVVTLVAGTVLIQGGVESESEFMPPSKQT